MKVRLLMKGIVKAFPHIRQNPAYAYGPKWMMTLLFLGLRRCSPAELNLAQLLSFFGTRSFLLPV